MAGYYDSLNHRGGIIYLKYDGALYDATGKFTYNLGRPKKEAIVGVEAVHGFKSTPQTPFIEGAITDHRKLDVAGFVEKFEGTVTLELANGKTISLKEAWYAGEGTVDTEEGEIGVRFEGMSCEEV